MSWLGIRHFRRSGPYTVFLVLAIALATTLFIGPMMTSDFSMADGLYQALEANPAHLTLQTIDHFLNSSEYRRVADTVRSLGHVSRVEIVAHQNSYEQWFFAINNDSIIHNQMRIETGPEWLAANETYVISGSPSIDEYPPGSQVEMFIECGYGPSYFPLRINMTVVGRVSLQPAHLKLARGDYRFELLPEADIWEIPENVFLVNWNATLAPLIDSLIQIVPVFTIGTNILIGLDSSFITNPYDLQAMLHSIEDTYHQIETATADSNMTLNNWIAASQEQLSGDIAIYVNQLLLSVIPSMFVAIYSGKIIGDISKAQRKREIQLFLARGLSNGAIHGATAIESVFFALASGTVAFLVGSFLIHWTVNSAYSAVPFFPSLPTVLETFLFSGVATLVAVLVPTWQMSRAGLDSPGAPSDETGSLRSRLFTWMIFLVGLYRIASWYTGFDPRLLAEGASNILALMFFSLWMTFHDAVAWIAPLLFLYGLSQIITRELPGITARFVRILGKVSGEVGAFSSRFWTRRTARMATLFLLIALVGSYSMWSMGVNATHRDHLVRSAYIEVGADARLMLESDANETQWLATLESLAAVETATPELEITATTNLGYAALHAIDAHTWMQVAFFEQYWFREVPSASAMEAISQDDLTIILDLAIGQRLSLGLGDSVQMTLPETNETIPLRIVGFFNRVPPYQQPSGASLQSSWSFVPISLLDRTNGSITVQKQMLLKLRPLADALRLEDELEESSPEITRVFSVASYVSTALQSTLLRAPLSATLVTSILSLGLASVGIVSIVGLALRERKQDLLVLSMRGFSSSMLSRMLAAELLAILVLALPVAYFVGFGWILGSIAALNNPLWLAKAQQLTGYTFALAGVDWLWLIGVFLLLTLASSAPTLYAADRTRRDVEELGEETWI